MIAKIALVAMQKHRTKTEDIKCQDKKLRHWNHKIDKLSLINAMEENYELLHALLRQIL